MKSQISWLVRFAANTGRYWDGFLSYNNPPSTWIYYGDADLTRRWNYRTRALNELVFDIDHKDWQTVVINANKLESTFNRYGIPFIRSVTGGKGMHYHIFIDYDGFDRAVHPLHILQYLYTYLTNTHGAKYVDTVFFTKKRQLIRDFGGMHARGCFKSVVDTIPHRRPCFNLSDVVFPKKIEIWRLSTDVTNNILVADTHPDEVSIPYVYNPVSDDNPEYPPRWHSVLNYGRKRLSINGRTD